MTSVFNTNLLNFRIPATLILLFLFTSSSLYSQSQVEWNYPMTIVKNEHYENGSFNATASQQLNLESFFSEYPNGKNLKKEHQELSAQLCNWDNKYLLLYIAGLLDFQMKVDKAAVGEIWDVLWGNQMDEFKYWASTVKRNLPTGYIKVPAEALRKAKKEYDAYARKRDRSIFKAHLDLDQIQNLDAYMLTLIALEKEKLSKPEVEEFYTNMQRQFGQSALLDAARQVQGAPKSSFGKVKNPQAVGPFASASPFQSLYGALAKNGPEVYLKVALGDVGYDTLSQICGKERLIEIASDLKDIPHTGKKINSHTNGYKTILEKYGYFKYNYHSGEMKLHLNYGDYPEFIIQRACNQGSSKDYTGLAFLDSNNPFYYTAALMKKLDSNATLADIARQVSQYDFFLKRFEFKSCKNAIAVIQSASKDDQYQIIDPASLGLSNTNPLLALEEYLELDLNPFEMYKKMFSEKFPYKAHEADDWYDKMANAIGREQLGSATKIIFEAKNNGTDPTTLKGAVSGFSEWEYAFGDILLSNLSPENVVKSVFHYHTSYTQASEQIGRLYANYEDEEIENAAKILASAPKSQENMKGYAFPTYLSDPQSLGIKSQRLDHALLDLIYLQKQKRLENTSSISESTSGNKETKKPTDGAFYIGQKFKIQVRGKWEKGEIIKKENDRFKVRYTFARNRYSISWFTLEELSKITK